MAKNKDKNVSQEKESASEAIFKKFKQNTGIYIGSVAILILVVVTFLGGDFISGGGFGAKAEELTFGYYDKTAVSYVPGNFLAENYSNVSRYYQSQGADLNDFWTSAQIWRFSFEGALTHTAVMEIMKRSGYSVPDRIVDREVAKLPQFQDNGRFSPVLYRQTSEANRLSIWRRQQDELIKRMYLYDLSDLFYPKGEAAFIANMAAHLRVYQVVSLNVDDFPESEYSSYARNNSELFNSIHMSKISVSSSEREARRVLASVRDGTVTFEDAARNQSTDYYSASGGDMGNRYFYELEREITSPADRGVIYSLRAGEISDVVVTPDGWSFFRIESALKPADFDDEAVMERARLYIGSYERGRMEDWAIARADEFSADVRASGFEAAAEEWGLQWDSFGPIAVNFGNVDLFTSLESFSVSNITSQDFTSLSRNEDFWKTILRTPVNTPSSPLVQGGSVLVFIPTEETEADTAFIESLETMYSTWWREYVSDQLIQQYFINSEKTNDMFWETFFRYFL